MRHNIVDALRLCGYTYQPKIDCWQKRNEETIIEVHVHDHGFEVHTNRTTTWVTTELALLAKKMRGRLDQWPSASVAH